VLQELGHERALVFYGEDGLDELTTTAASHVFELEGGSLREYRLDPQELGLHRSASADLRGGTPAENAAIIRQVFEGEKGARREVVMLNAAAAAVAAGSAKDFREGLALAARSIDSGAAGRALDRLVRTSTAVKEPT
jgi:anthranilate phosphoribosyltransferase